MNYIKKKIGYIGSKEIYLISFTNDNNFTISFYNLGGYIHCVLIPYKNNPNKCEDVILGYNKFEDCKIFPSYFNSIIGRVGNRIANSLFYLNGKKYKLFNNEGNHHLHGGENGFNKKVWNVNSIRKDKNELSCELEYFSKHLEEGYPGNLNCKTTYTLNNDNEFIIIFNASSDEDTVVNMTNHNYWNFHGHNDYYQNITNHSIKIYSHSVCENDSASIPTGNLIGVKNTKFDFQNRKNISQEFLDEGGVDNNYDIGENLSIRKVAEVYSNLTKMGVTYFTDQPGVQFYTGNMMANEYNGKENKKYGKNFGLCFEPQFFPDAINQPKFKSPILKAGENYLSSIVMRLGNDF